MNRGDFWPRDISGLCQNPRFDFVPVNILKKSCYLCPAGIARDRVQIYMYSGPCILRPPLQPGIFGLKWEVVLKWRDIYTENMRMVSLIVGLKMEGIVKWRGLKSQGPL